MSFQITVTDDILSEDAETFRIGVLASSLVGRGSPSELTVTIPANDPVSYSLSAPPGGEAPEGSTAEFEVGLGGVQTASPVTLTYRISGVAATDYTDPGNGSITIPAGSTRATIAIQIDGDATAEAAEVLTVTLTGDASGAASVTIPENAANVREFFVIGNFTAITEGDSARSYDVSFRPVSDPANNADLPSDTVVRWSLEPGSGANPIEPADFSVTSGTVSFTSGAKSTGTFMITVTDDNLNEGTESFQVRLRVESGDTAGSAGAAPVAGTVTDNAADAITVSLTAGTATINEGEATTQTLVRSGGTPTAENVVVPLLVGPDDSIWADVEIRNSDANGVRIIPVPTGVPTTGGLFAFAVFTATNGEYATNATFKIRAKDDNLLEEQETVSVTIGSPTNPDYATVPGVGSAGTVNRQATPPNNLITIPANDPVMVAVAPVRGQENGVGEGSELRYTVTFSNNQPSADISVSMEIEGVAPNPTENADFDAQSSGWSTSTTVVTISTTIPLASVMLGQPIDLPSLRVTAGDGEEEEETFQLTVVPSGGGVARSASFEPFSPREVVVPSKILRIDTEPPGLNGVGYALNDPTRRVWLRSGDPELAILTPADAAAPAGSGERSGAMLDGFSVVVMNRPTDTRTVNVQARYSSPNVIVLTLPEGAGLTAEDEGVFARYVYPDSGLGIFDRSLEAGLRPADNQRRNQQEGPLMITLTAFSETADTDDDGIPDAAEARLAGGDPLTPVRPEEGVPQVSVADGTRYFAYSGIREFGGDAAMLLSHLGLTIITGTVATDWRVEPLRAYYLRDTDSDPDTDLGNSCASGQFPASYADPVANDGCELVDFLNMPAGKDYKIGWVVKGASGYWATTGTGSRLPEQTVHRVPEINMLSQRLHLTKTGGPDMVFVEAEHDGPMVPGLMLTVSPQTDRMVGVDGRRFTLPVSRISRTYSIFGLSGGDAELYRPSSTDATVRPDEDSYSLGLAEQTKVVLADRVRPTLGVPKLMKGTSARNVVVRGESYTLMVGTKGVKDYVQASPPTADGVGVESPSPLSLTNDETLPVEFTVSTNTNSMSLHVTVRGGGLSTSATYSWPVVLGNNTLVGEDVTDNNNDGIPDEHELHDDLNHLPVLVNDHHRSGTAGEVRSHHMRPARPHHQLRIGRLALERAAAAATAGAVIRYRDYSVSVDTAGKVRYDFEVYGVDYDEDGVSGGRVGFIIPLPRMLYDGEGRAQDHNQDHGWIPAKFDVHGNEHLYDSADYAFAPLNALGNCPTDTQAYRDGAKKMDDACLAVWIVDGSRYDEDCWIDGVPRGGCPPNGIVRDPLGFDVVRPGGSSGGSVGLLGIALLMLATAATLLRRRRARP